mgnify:CR=1 FL=1
MKLLNLNEAELKALNKALSFFYNNGWIDEDSQNGFDSLVGKVTEVSK